MRQLKLFNNHSGYTEVSSSLPIPSVSYCSKEKHVHYNNVRVLAGNEEVWELYSSLVCDEERLTEDLKNRFSQYLVTVENYSNEETTGGMHPELEYVDEGYLFKYNEGFGRNECKIFTSRNVPLSTYSDLALDAVTNDCGQNVLPGEYGVGEWTFISEAVIDPGPGVVT